ncbi:hypothetical protein Pd630_LPD06052 [Rhodococcus opacus PD630]|nr:hypothetical protein Pd630_LPD06052 [Rhodococcus opacus PD630]
MPGRARLQRSGDGHDVDLDHVHLGVRVGRGHRAERGQAGVVDEDVEGEPELADPVEQRRAGRAVGEIGTQHMRPTACGPQLGGQFLQLLRPTGDEYDLVTAAGEFTADRFADPGRRSGDERGAIGGRGGQALNCRLNV